MDDCIFQMQSTPPYYRVTGSKVTCNQGPLLSYLMQKSSNSCKTNEMQRQISVLKMPKFWTDAAGSSILRTKFNKGHEKNDVEWGYLYTFDCKICKRKNVNQNECKHRNPCKLYVIKHEEDVLRIKRMSVNAKLPVRSSAEAAGYDLSTAQAVVIPAHGKCLVKTGLAISMPSGCYGRIAPRSGLAI